MTKSYEQVISQIKRLQTQADGLRKRERANAIVQAKDIIRRFDLTGAELGLIGKPNGKTRVAAKPKKFKIAPKYKGPKGELWSGRGINPTWLREAMAKGKKKDDFLIKR